MKQLDLLIVIDQKKYYYQLKILKRTVKKLLMDLNLMTYYLI